MKNNPLPRLDKYPELKKELLPYCRLKRGEIWKDPFGKHKVGCFDATDDRDIKKILGTNKARLAIHDPPYNQVAFKEKELSEYIKWCKKWIEITNHYLSENASLYIWLGADQKRGFQPLPDFMIMMRSIKDFKAKSFITLRNQRGYGTQKNWMAVRQELLYYTKGNPYFCVQYTDIPKILKGYYKKVGGKVTENIKRGKSKNIRSGNVWVDIQQVFYRREENVSGCYTQKPIRALDRIVVASSKKGDLVIDFFAHSGTTLLACEHFKRTCYTIDIDPVFCEIAIRRLELFRNKRLLGWQNSNPFEDIFGPDNKLFKEYTTRQRTDYSQLSLF